MKKLKLLLFIFLSFCSFQAYAYDATEGNVTALLGPFLYKSNFNGSPGAVRSPAKTDIAIVMTGDINSTGALELSLFHMNKVYLREQGPYSATEETQLMNLTMGFRRWLNPYLSLALAFSSAYSMGDPTVTYTNFPVTTNTDTSARDLTEYAFEFSVQSELWSNRKYAVVADARYSYSVTPKADEKADHYGLIVGFRYLIQERHAHREAYEQ